MAFLRFQCSTVTKAVGVVGTGVLLVAVACHILCMATPYYFTLSSEDARSVQDLLPSPNWLIAPRALSIVGLVLAVMGVVSMLVFTLTNLEKLPYLLLATAAGTSILGGILILSADIAFAAEKTIDFYSYQPKEAYFFHPLSEPALLVQNYDKRFSPGWSFILDLISGALCIVSGPIFVYIALRLQWKTSRAEREPLDNAKRQHQRQIMNTSL